MSIPDRVQFVESQSLQKACADGIHPVKPCVIVRPQGQKVTISYCPKCPIGSFCRGRVRVALKSLLAGRFGPVEICAILKRVLA